MLVFAALLAVHAGLAGTIPSAPENITVTFLNPNSVRVSWQTSVDLQTNPVEKYDVTYKPTDARVVAVVAGNSEAVILHGLSPDTQYQLTVSAVWSGRKYRSRPIVFRTLEPPRSSQQYDSGTVIVGSGPPMSPNPESGQGFGIFTDDVVSLASNNSSNSTLRELPTIRGVEVGIVVLVLIVWAGAIALFFNRWGKIRMLLPYQPDYKQEQLKVPGSGVCSGSQCNGQHSHQRRKSRAVSLYMNARKSIHYDGEDDFWLNPNSVLDNSAKTVAFPKCRVNGGIEENKGLLQNYTIDEKREGSVTGAASFPPAKHFHCLSTDEPSTTIAERCTRSRINSAIFVSSEGRGFDSIEFLRRHGSQSVLCRKARSAENVSDEERKRRFSENQQWSTMDSSNPSETIELAECHATPSSAIPSTSAECSAHITIAPSTSIIFPNAATVTTTANSIVGSISIETPPRHILQKQKSTSSQTSITSSNSPIALNLKSTKPRPKLSNLPTLSVSGPSPPSEEEFL